MADVSGDIVIDIWKNSSFPPAAGDKITGTGTPPTISTDQSATSNDFTDWTTVSISANDYIAFNVNSCTTITRINLVVEVSVP